MEPYQTDITISDKSQVEFYDPCPHCLCCSADAEPKFHKDSCRVATEARRKKRETERINEHTIELETEA